MPEQNLPRSIRCKILHSDPSAPARPGLFIFVGMDATILNKLRHYCAYQERCHEEVRTKLLSLKVYGDRLEEVISQLVQEDFLNEERYAKAYAGEVPYAEMGRAHRKRTPVQEDQRVLHPSGDGGNSGGRLCAHAGPADPFCKEKDMPQAHRHNATIS